MVLVNLVKGLICCNWCIILVDINNYMCFLFLLENKLGLEVLFRFVIIIM